MTPHGDPESADRSFPEPDSLSLPLLEDALDHPHGRAADGSAGAAGDGTAGEAAVGVSDVDGGAAPAVELKPRWRGWIHAGTFPLATAAGIVLIALGDGPVAKWAAVVYTLSSMLLFGVSALYHRFNWRPQVKQVFRRLDHANIFLLIAGTYTPLALLALPLSAGIPLLIVVWAGALLGIGFRVFWIGAPRWLYVPLYLLLGWAAVMYLGEMYRANPATMVLVVVGGLLYTVGSVVYALKRPNPVPGVFGFHEIFHALTVLAFLCHWTGALLVALDPVYLR